MRKSIMTRPYGSSGSQGPWQGKARQGKARHWFQILAISHRCGCVLASNSGQTTLRLYLGQKARKTGIYKPDHYHLNVTNLHRNCCSIQWRARGGVNLSVSACQNIELAGYPASLGPLPPLPPPPSLPASLSLSSSLPPFLPPCLPPVRPSLSLSIFGLPGVAQNICVIAQDNCVPEILFKT